MSIMGQRQQRVLKCLVTRGPFPGSGWTYSTHSETAAILDTLVARGLVEKTDQRYRVTDAGRDIYAFVSSLPAAGKDAS